MKIIALAALDLIARAQREGFRLVVVDNPAACLLPVIARVSLRDDFHLCLCKAP